MDTEEVVLGLFVDMRWFWGVGDKMKGGKRAEGTGRRECIPIAGAGGVG